MSGTPPETTHFRIQRTHNPVLELTIKSLIGPGITPGARAGFEGRDSTNHVMATETEKKINNMILYVFYSTYYEK